MILAIDPSFSSTGVALATDDGTILKTCKICKKGACYDTITENHKACLEICAELDLQLDSDSKLFVIIEYPAFSTFSGGFLGILHGFLAYHFLHKDNVQELTWVPPTAVDSYIKNKLHSKSFIVQWCKENGFINKRTSHDECTAIVLVQILTLIHKGEWKKSAFTERPSSKNEKN